jgi:hypothetical protein
LFEILKHFFFSSITNDNQFAREVAAALREARRVEEERRRREALVTTPQNLQALVKITANTLLVDTHKKCRIYLYMTLLPVCWLYDFVRIFKNGDITSFV